LKNVGNQTADGISIENKVEIKINGNHQLSGYHTSSKYLLLCFKERKKRYFV